jgi:RNA polymerase sigma-70 factor (ECF subfamily)
VEASKLATADDIDLVRELPYDPVAVEEFYRRHVRSLTSYATRRLSDSEAASDIVANAFVAAIESAAGFDPARGRPGAWLFGITSNLIASELRRRSTESRAVARLCGQLVPQPDEYARLDELMDARRRAGPVAEVLESLPTAERELVDLLLHGDLTVSEAARILGIRPATARMRLSRARLRLGVSLDGL